MAEWIPGIAAYEEHRTRTEIDSTISGNMPSARVTLGVAYADYNSARNILLGGTGFAPNLGPCKWPYDDAIRDMYAVAINDVTDGGRFTTVAVERLSTAMRYMTVDYMARVGNYCTKEGVTYYVEDAIEPTFMSRPMNHHELQWYTAPKYPLTSNEAPVIPISGAMLSHTVSGFFSADPAWEEAIGTLPTLAYNSTNLARSFSNATMMLRSVQVRQEMTHNSYLSGQPTFTVTFRYEIKSESWNLFWRVVEAGERIADLIQHKNSGSIVYPFREEDHSDWLFDCE